MENVTDSVFRQMICETSKPDLFFTEFVSTDGLISQGRENISTMLKFTAKEKPIIAQIWGNCPEKYKKAGKIIRGMGFDGIDVNMGCPDKNIVAKGCCSGLINNPSLAEKLFLAVKESAGNLPVSIKTRIGYNKIDTKRWITFLLKLNPAAITIHGRTVKEMSKVPAHWEEIGFAVKIRNSLNRKTLIIGNGDVLSLKEGKEKCEKYGTDGIMIGRGIFHNIWLFDENTDILSKAPQEKISLLIKHISLFDKTWGKIKPFRIMKKYYKIYICGFTGANSLRIKLMELTNLNDTVSFLKKQLLAFS